MTAKVKTNWIFNFLVLVAYRSLLLIIVGHIGQYYKYSYLQGS